MYKKRLILWGCEHGLLLNGSCATGGVSWANQKVSLNSNTHVNTAVQILEYFSMAETGKKVIKHVEFQPAISTFRSLISIGEQPLDLIVLRNKLLLEEGAGYFCHQRFGSGDRRGEPAKSSSKSLPSKRMRWQNRFRIKAVAVLADRSYIKTSAWIGQPWQMVKYP